MKNTILTLTLVVLTLTLKPQTWGVYEENSTPAVYEQELGAFVSDTSNPVTSSPMIQRFGLGDQQFGGILPKDMELFPSINKLFISGSSGFRVLNTQTNLLEHKVVSTQSGRYVNFEKLFMPNRRIASCINLQANRNEVFWMNENGYIFIYDADTYDCIQVLLQPSSFPKHYLGNQIVYNSYTKELYRMENSVGTNGDPFGTYIAIYKYNHSSGLYEKSSQTNIYTPSIVTDIAFNEIRSRFYLVTDDGVEIYSATPPYSIINKISSSSIMGNIEYVYNPTFNKHEVFCTPRDTEDINHKAIIIDGDDDFSYQTCILPNTHYYGTTYNPFQNKYYLYNSMYTGIEYATIEILNAANYSLLSSFQLQTAFMGDFHFMGSQPTDTKVFLSTLDDIYVIDGNTNNVTSIDYYGCNMGDLEGSSATGNLYCSSLRKGTVEVLSTTGEYLSSVAIGYGTREAIFNKTENKVYYFSTSRRKYNSIYSQDFETGTISHIEAGSALSDVVLDEVKNQLLISHNDARANIYSIDCSSDGVPSVEYTLTAGYVHSLYVSSNRKLYVLRSNSKLDIIDMNTKTLLQSHVLHADWGQVGFSCTEDTKNDIVYMSMFQTYGGGSGRLFSFNDITGDINQMNTNTNYYSFTHNPREIQYVGKENNLYLMHASQHSSSRPYISVIDLDETNPENRIHEILFDYGSSLSDIDYATNQNALIASFVRKGHNNKGKVFIINC